MFLHRFSLFFAAGLCLTLLPLNAMAQALSGGPLDITADSLEYLSNQKLMVGRGNVMIRDGDTVLTADYMSVQTESMDVYAKGNVFYQSGTSTWKGDEFRYNMKTKQGDFGSFKSYYDPFYVKAGESRRTGENSFEVENVTITTCEGDNPVLSVQAREGSVRNNRIRMSGATIWIADIIPIFYMPYYTRSLDSHEYFFQFLPGYNSRLGAFLRTAYNYPLFGDVRGRTHLDYFTRRGLALGQDFLWQDEEKTYQGMIQGYYIKDDDPFRGDNSGERQGVVEEERYRLRLSHVQAFTDVDNLYVEANYLSDPYFLRDFFRGEYREAVQPENRLSLTHRDDNFIAGLQVIQRLNDFYENVNRSPELTLDVPRLNVFDTDLYYESRNAASYLERVYPEGSTTEDYDSFRFDTDHMLYYPLRVGGFLNIIPRAGYRGTFYSSTLSTTITTNTLLQTPTNAPAFTTNQILTTVNDEGAAVRSIPKLGWEGSFKAFKTRNDVLILGDGDGLRHVAEPYLDHTYEAEPNVLPDELPQFDAVDRLDIRHDIKLGMRNKIQTRRAAGASEVKTNLVDAFSGPRLNPVDIINLDVFTFYRVEKEEDAEDFSDIFWKGDLRFHRNLLIEIDGSYNFYESDLNTFNTRAIADFSDSSRVTLEHRYRLDQQSQLGAYVSLFPNNRWAFEAGTRYDIEFSELEEHYYIIKRNGQCVSWGLGYRETLNNVDDDEFEVWLQLWVTAFPQALIDVGY